MTEIRRASLQDLKYLDALRKRESDALGFIPVQRYEMEVNGEAWKHLSHTRGSVTTNLWGPVYDADGVVPTVLSLFSGIGGFDLALERVGFQIVGQCEIDPFCNKVLAKHWPEVRRYGDIRDIKVSSAARQQRPWRVDLVCGGFPCQDLSVAGKRAGLHGARSGLWFEFLRILSGLRPAFCLVENVPGLLSSNQGRDFAIILDGLGELWPAVGWCVLDSQHFGVPQRRRRVFIIGGPTRASVQQILSICESCGGDSQTGRATGQDIAAPLGASATSFGGQRYDLDNETYIPDLAPSVLAHEAKHGNVEGGKSVLIAHTLRTDGFDAGEELSYALTNPGSGGRTHSRQLYDGSTVRRLTAVECERLQMFPDGWTCICGAGANQAACRCPDGPRYRSLGNAVTTSVITYIGERIKAVLDERTTTHAV